MTYMELVSTKYSLLEGGDNWQNRLCYITVTLHKVLQVNFCHDNDSPFKGYQWWCDTWRSILQISSLTKRQLLSGLLSERASQDILLTLLCYFLAELNGIGCIYHLQWAEWVSLHKDRSNCGQLIDPGKCIWNSKSLISKHVSYLKYKAFPWNLLSYDWQKTLLPISQHRFG